MVSNTKKGFTLIELLVVIAIIGILASVVLASLNTARQSGSDAAIQSSVNNARAQAELWYSENDNSYDDDTSNVCDTDLADVNSLAQFTQGATDAGSGDVECADEAQAWAIEAQLVSDTGEYYCVDSTGFAGEVTGGSIAEGSDYECE